MRLVSNSYIIVSKIVYFPWYFFSSYYHQNMIFFFYRIINFVDILSIHSQMNNFDFFSFLFLNYFFPVCDKLNLKISKTWGGAFEVKFITNWKKIVQEKKR